MKYIPPITNPDGSVDLTPVKQAYDNGAWVLYTPEKHWDKCILPRPVEFDDSKGYYLAVADEPADDFTLFTYLVDSHKVVSMVCDENGQVLGYICTDYFKKQFVTPEECSPTKRDAVAAAMFSDRLFRHVVFNSAK